MIRPAIIRPALIRQALAAAIAGLALAACAPSPAPSATVRPVEAARDYPLPQPAAWQALMAWIGSTPLIVKVADGESGLLYASASYGDNARLESYADCGDAGFNFIMGTELDIGVTVKPAAGGSRTTVTANWRRQLSNRALPSLYSWQPCRSTGKFEAELLAAIR